MSAGRDRLLALLAALAIAATLAACGSDDEGGESGGTGEEVGQAMETITPAEIDPRPQGFASSDVLSPVENAWRAGSHESFTEVDAGSFAPNRKVGALVIFRHDFLTAEQTANLVEVDGAKGPLRITDAPEGPDVVVEAQQEGKIGFVGRDGTKGTLDLSDDSVSVDGG